MDSALLRATYAITEADLPSMVLYRNQLPPELRSFHDLREGPLDNRAMAEHSLPGNTEEKVRATGRITGYLKEFMNPAAAEATERPSQGMDLVAATVVHLFENEASVSTWMRETFVRQFEEQVGELISPGQQVLQVDRLEIPRFADEAVALRVLQGNPVGILSSTVLDLRVGRLLGVAYVASAGTVERADLVVPMARELERQMVRVALGSR